MVAQKFYRNPMKGAEYGFYWNYATRPYWSMLEYVPAEMRLKERLLVKLKERAYDFYFVPPRRLFTSGDSTCHIYEVSESGTAVEIKTFPGCNPKTLMTTYMNVGVLFITPEGREVKMFAAVDTQLLKDADTVVRYDYPIASCWYDYDLVCVPDTGIYEGATDVVPLEEDRTLITYPWGLRLMDGKDTVLNLRTPSRPLSSTYAHGLLHVALGSNGILTVDVRRGSYTYYRGITAVSLYSSFYGFVLLVEDMDGCLHVFRPVFRPPSVRYVGKAETTFCGR